MTVTTDTSISRVRSLVRDDAPSRAIVRDSSGDASEFSRVLRSESAAARQPSTSQQTTGTGSAAASGAGATASSAASAATAGGSGGTGSTTTGSGATASQPALHYNVQGLVTAKGEASIPPTVIPAAAQSVAQAVATPTAEEVFGANPWLTSPTGYSAAMGVYNYNPLYFATRQTAETVAKLLGGTVVEQNAMVGNASPFLQTQANYMVQLPNGHLVNAGLTASYYTHGWSQAQIDRMLECDRNV